MRNDATEKYPSHDMTLYHTTDMCSKVDPRLRAIKRELERNNATSSQPYCASLQSLLPGSHSREKECPTPNVDVVGTQRTTSVHLSFLS